MAPCFLVVAAGRSKRFGSNKLEAKFENNVSVLEAVLSKTCSAGFNVFLVVSHKSDFLQQITDKVGGELLVMGGQSLGLGDTIAFGVNNTPDRNGWIVCLADMPFIRPETYAQVAKYSSEYDLVAPCFQQKRGHPVFFSKRFRSDLLGLGSDEGAKNILKNEKNRLFTFETADAGIIQDVDYPEDLSWERGRPARNN